MSAIRTIRNLGPAMEAAFASAGIASAEALQDMGAEAAYARLLQTGHKPHFMAYLALTLGLQGRPWTDAGAEERAALRRVFDGLIAQHSGSDRTRRERLLDELGVIPSQPRTSPPRL
jgi:TfoX C-terminal domain.